MIITPDAPIDKTELIQMIRMGKSIHVLISFLAGLWLRESYERLENLQNI